MDKSQPLNNHPSRFSCSQKRIVSLPNVHPLTHSSLPHAVLYIYRIYKASHKPMGELMEFLVLDARPFHHSSHNIRGLQQIQRTSPKESSVMQVKLFVGGINCRC